MRNNYLLCYKKNIPATKSCGALIQRPPDSFPAPAPQCQGTAMAIPGWLCFMAGNCLINRIPEGLCASSCLQNNISNRKEYLDQVYFCKAVLESETKQVFHVSQGCSSFPPAHTHLPEKPEGKNKRNKVWFPQEEIPGMGSTWIPGMGTTAAHPGKLRG